MTSRVLFALCFAGGLSCSAAFAQVAPPAHPPVHAPGGIWISIKNVYEAELNFGPLGHGSRTGVDTAEGALSRTADGYSGTVTATVRSTQHRSGMLGTGSCGPGTYDDSQELEVIGHSVDGFNTAVQTVNWNPSMGHEFLMLEFKPKTMTSQQPGPRLPPRGPQDPFLEDLEIDCHTLIDTPSGIAFLPLNDSRWTMDGGGYILGLPPFGTLQYTDNTVTSPGGAQLGPFKAKKSEWTIYVERL